MRTDYFDDLLPDSVTSVTTRKHELVTLEKHQQSHENNELSDVLPVLPLLPVKTSNTEHEGRTDPFQSEFPVSAEKVTPMPQADWTCSQWQAYVERGQTAAARRKRLGQAPEPLRRRIISHVRTVFSIQFRVVKA